MTGKYGLTTRTARGAEDFVEQRRGISINVLETSEKWDTQKRYMASSGGGRGFTGNVKKGGGARMGYRIRKRGFQLPPSSKEDR